MLTQRYPHILKRSKFYISYVDVVLTLILHSVSKTTIQRYNG